MNTEKEELKAHELADKFAQIISYEPDFVISESLLWNLLESIPLNISIWKAGKVVYANPSFYRTFGIKEKDIDALNRLVEGEGYVSIHPDDFDYNEEDTLKLKNDLNGGLVFHRELRMKSHIEQDYRWFNTYVVKGKDAGSNVTIEIDEDITVAKTITLELENTLKQKDVLLKEIHHRVKNNFQLISSLIRIQMNMLTEKSPRVVLEEILGRVSSLTMVHEKLYRSSDLSNISIREQVKDVTVNLSALHFKTSFGVKIKMDIDDIRITVDKAIPLSLIFNELLSNCFKSAFIERDEKEIMISLKEKDGEYILIVKDNGIGFPDSIVKEKNRTLGLSIVETLTRQLSGKLRLYNDTGAAIEIIFPR